MIALWLKVLESWSEDITLHELTRLKIWLNEAGDASGSRHQLRLPLPPLLVHHVSLSSLFLPRFLAYNERNGFLFMLLMILLDIVHSVYRNNHCKTWSSASVGTFEPQFAPAGNTLT